MDTLYAPISSSCTLYNILLLVLTQLQGGLLLQNIKVMTQLVAEIPQTHSL